MGFAGKTLRSVGTPRLLLFPTVRNLVRDSGLIGTGKIEDTFGHTLIQPHRHPLRSAENDAIARLILAGEHQRRFFWCCPAGEARDSNPLPVLHFNMKRYFALTPCLRRLFTPRKRSANQR